MKKWLLAILFGAALVLAACGGNDDNNGNDNGNNNNQENNEQENTNGDNNGENNTDNNGETASAAEEAFKDSCASCHGDNLDDGYAPDLTEIGSKYDADEIATIIEEGKGGMPAQDVSDDDRELISEWLADKK